jgi:pentatricopeptide repeat protein
MRQSGVAPNELCYNLLIRACSVGGRLDEMTDIMRKLVSAPPPTPPRLHCTHARRGCTRAHTAEGRGPPG